MQWFNVFGLIFMVAIMVPNIIFAAKNPAGFENKYKNKTLEMLEQIGRFGCFGCMIFHIPGTWFGCWSDQAFVLHLAGNSALTAAYCVIWTICWKKDNVFKALALSILPSVVFLFSGVMSRSALLILFALLFAPAHILISYKNAKRSGDT